jgi:uncharacterized membrane protein
MRKFLLVLVIICMMCYPIAIFFGLSHFSPRYVALLIILIFIVRLVLIKSSANILSKVSTITISLIGIVLCLWAAISNTEIAVRLYPVFVSLVLLLIFGYSLLFPPTIIERIARLTSPNLPPAAIQYTYKVTLVWCAFFIFNGVIALLTALFSPLRIWTLYNGLISYILIGIIFMVEFIIRWRVKKKIMPASSLDN